MFLYVLGLLPIPVQIFTAVLMYRRKQHRSYPAFWMYLWFESARLIGEAVLWPLHWHKTYFYVYWGTGLASALFILVVLREIFSRALAGYSQITTLRRRGYEIAFAFVTLAAVLLLARIQVPKFFTREIIHIQQAVSVVAVAMLIFVGICSVLLGIKLTSEQVGIAIGVGLLGMGDVLTYTLTLLRARYTPDLIGWIESIFYDFAFILVAGYVLAPQHVRVPSDSREDLTEWARSMSENLSK